VSKRGKHIKVRFTYEGHPLTVIVASSPSDWRAEQNKMAFIRRMLREAAPKVT
jgi:hypothetical protein